MTQHIPPHALSLFDLLARTWDLGTEIRDLRFNVVGSTVAVTLADGALAFLQVADAEGPETRMRSELETGRMTIRPREKPLPLPARSQEPVAAVATGLCPVAQQGFAFVHHDGAEIWRATARGQVLRIARAGEGRVTALSALPDKRGLVVARGARMDIMSPETGITLVSTGLEHAVTRIAVSADAQRIACWGEGQLTVLNTADLACLARIAAEGRVIRLRWSPEGRWIVGGCADKALLLVDVAKGQVDRIVDFPAPVTAVAFSSKANAMIASGAFRVVGWHLPDLPFGPHEGVSVETGKPGLTLVETVAVHPLRDLCAVGYANGLVTICQIGRREEMMLREGRGDAVTALAWSPDGAHLAIGTAAGAASIATFPKTMFK
ncbi:WD40 repeat domain-containing protein [Natronohydrobacter thiooxidans]|uniref:WD40 repeat domain-containing protein n=1 Tax=Natronohydrobacter thiooxidans TaxID=87172 RepID=UPI0008FF776B|nr:hypothetical protein [Natronohydrobacter thiooxidans]